MKELRDIKRSAGLKDGVFDADLVDDNLFEWDVWLRGGGFDPESKLAQDLLALKEYGDDYAIFPLSLPPTFGDSRRHATQRSVRVLGLQCFIGC